MSPASPPLSLQSLLPIPMPAIAPSCPTTLIVGYGNTLRRDDGVGYRMADTIAQWNLPGIESRSVHQLTPDLAADLATVDRVLFIDVFALEGEAGQAAIALGTPVPYRLEALSPGDHLPNLGHSSNPRSLLALAQSLYGVTCPGWWLLIPGWDFGFGEEFSDLTTTAQAQALGDLQTALLDPHDRFWALAAAHSHSPGLNPSD